VYELREGSGGGGGSDCGRSQSSSGSGSDEGASGGLIGTIYLDPSACYGTRMLLHGGGSMQAAAAASAAAVADVSGGGGELGFSGAPAVAIGLQSRGQLGGPNLALGLWELAHEMGHALHFLLSATGQDRTTASANSSSNGVVWWPPELAELPSTLFEQLVMCPDTLQHLLRPSAPGGSKGAAVSSAAPAERVRQLAALMEATWRCPVQTHQLVRRVPGF